MNELDKRRIKNQLEQLYVNIDKMEIAILEQEEQIAVFIKNREEQKERYHKDIEKQKEQALELEEKLKGGNE